MTADGWEVTFYLTEREHYGKPVQPVVPPAVHAYARNYPQRYLITARLGADAGHAIVAVCQEARVHSIEERETFVSNIALLCEQQIGGSNV